MSDATIRRARAEDVSRIITLIAQLSLDVQREKDPHDPAYARAFAAIDADPRQHVVVVERDGTVIGTGTLVLIPNLSHGGRDVAQLESVVVDASCRGGGLGEALVRHLIEEARARGAFRVQLTSHSSRTAAHRFYERLGFVASHTGFKLTL